jgi:hypothetical protein
MNAPTSLVPLVEANPALVLLEPAKFDQFFDEIAREVRSHVPDLSTDKGRKAIASLAYKVSTTKTAIDEARELLTKEKRDEIKAVDAAGKLIRDRLDALRDEVKAPLVEWQEAEKARLAKCEETIQALRRDGVVLGDDTSETVAGRLDLVRSVEITDEFGELASLAQTLKDTAINHLEAGAARLRQAEEERTELARLRAAEETRLAREAEERAAAEAKAVAEIAERERAEAADRAKKAEEERIAGAAREAEERARAEAERAAQELQDAERRAHETELTEARRRADAAEAARKAEADRIASEKAAQEAAERREAEAKAKRQADIDHQSKIMGEAKSALMAQGVGEATAKAIVIAIKANLIPHVSIEF